ncbi:hypothetical protein SAMN05421783_1147 [Thiocapsa roseopersicina]|uniref:Uncharacterized protein n=1 Tax=Thiocapsa roseopersicina TaxID=1058 RepID=A0A1H2YWR3_THIRO|nr:hypothetical protein SAMN05421783_1147 [Thiocapsa roseopersicina]
MRATEADGFQLVEVKPGIEAEYTWADQDRGTDDGVGYGFAVGKPIAKA